jgi:hypothetical protein
VAVDRARRSPADSLSRTAAAAGCRATGLSPGPVFGKDP